MRCRYLKLRLTGSDNAERPTLNHAVAVGAQGPLTRNVLSQTLNLKYLRRVRVDPLEDRHERDVGI